MTENRSDQDANLPKSRQFNLALPPGLQKAADNAIAGSGIGEALHPKLEACKEEVPLASSFIYALQQLADRLPESVNVKEKDARSSANEWLEVVDEIRTLGLLSLWKVASLIQASLGYWDYGPPRRMEPLPALAIVRAVLEESSRYLRAADEIDSLANAPTAAPQLLRRLSRLLSVAETTGYSEGLKASIGIASQIPHGLHLGNKPNSAVAVKDLYSYLSTVSHPEGLSRDVFFHKGWVGAFRLSPRPAVAHHRSAIVAWVAALSLSARWTANAWQVLESVVTTLIEENGLDLAAGRLATFPDDFEVQDGGRISCSIDGVWVYCNTFVE